VPQNAKANLKGAGNCTSAKRMPSILRHIAKALVLNCALVTYIMMTADVGLLTKRGGLRCGFATTATRNFTFKVPGPSCWNSFPWKLKILVA